MRAFRAEWIVGLALGLSVGVGCGASSVFICGADEDCGEGRCEDNGYCAFPSTECESGWVYGELSAPQLAGECVGPGGGSGSGSGSGDGEDDGSSSTGGRTTGADSSGGVEPPPATSTTDDPSASDSATTGPGVCPDGVESLLVWVEEGELEPPMQFRSAEALPGEPVYAYSSEEEQGSITIGLDLTCPGPYYAWALVLDDNPGDFEIDDPDSFYVSLDDGPEVVWEYGCAFDRTNEVGWQWVPIVITNECPLEPSAIPVGAGPHTFRARNREAGTQDAAAGIAASFLTTDPGANPNDVFPVR